MKYSLFTRFCQAVVAIVLIAGVTGSAVAAETKDPKAIQFRVDSGVFRMGEEKPFSRIVTVFAEGTVYDLMLDAKKIAIFDEASGNFTLINTEKEVQTVVPMSFINKAIERLAERAAAKNDPKTQFLYNPNFDAPQKDLATGDFIFASPWLTYRVSAKQGDVEAARRYHLFANASAKLNTVIQPGNNPPFSRILVNQFLADRTMLPKTIFFVDGEESNPQATRLRSEHRYETNLDAASLQNIEKIKELTKKLDVIPLDAYLKL